MPTISPCKFCKGTTHQSFQCFSRPKKKPQIRKHIRKVGKVGRQWIAVRNEWIQKNLPDSGHWDCYICGVALFLNTLTLDHIKSRSRHPELRYELSNLAPCCFGCNSRKGSVDLEEMEDAHGHQGRGR